MDSWSLLTHPEEEGRSSKTNRYDEGCLLDSSYLRGLGPLFAELRGHGDRTKRWPFTYLELSQAVQLAAAEIGAGKLTLYQLRHSGASIDASRRTRSLEEIRRRGCWAQAKSMHRYEHSSRLSAEYERFPADQRRLYEACEVHLMRIMLGQAHPVRFSRRMLTWQSRAPS